MKNKNIISNLGPAINWALSNWVSVKEGRGTIDGVQQSRGASLDNGGGWYVKEL